MAENNQFERTCLTFGRENMEKIFASRVIVFGIGGVGSYVVEALARGGVHHAGLLKHGLVVSIA